LAKTLDFRLGDVTKENQIAKDGGNNKDPEENAEAIKESMSPVASAKPRPAPF
jgi:hypothetical protein